uniref:ATP-dependent RNA helicase n=1 Tax=Triatoma infestans TaxID=30076 RepID=A0A023F7D5_TRIIF
MTMEDIALNIYVPSMAEESKKKAEEKVRRKTADTSKSIFHAQKNVKKKNVKSVVEDSSSRSKLKNIPSHFHVHAHIGITSNVDNSPIGEKSEKKLLKRTADIPTRQLDGHKTVKKKKGIAEDSSKLNNHSVSLFNQSNNVINISGNGDVEPIYEPLFSAKTFESLGLLHPHLVANLEQLFNIKTMTVVQQSTIPVLFSRKDALVRSQTGSGKTLAYAVPILNFLQDVRPKISRSDGVKALVVVPTRELALQTYECFQKLVRAFTWLVPGILIGGEKRKSEKARIRKGITILIGTPGRLLDHTKRTKSLSLRNVQWLVLDEADKLLDLGYEEAVGNLLEVLRMEQDDDVEKTKTVQTVLLSATLTPGVERLAGLALNSPVRLDASESKTENLNTDDVLSHFVIPQTLDQKYVIVPTKLRLVLLTAIIKYYQLEKANKVLIFMATQDMVNFYTELLSCVPEMENISFFKLHGNMTQIGRTEVFKKFRSTVSGVLLCTDVGARGLDLPKTDVIIQYNAPPNPADYVHRVGRTARVGSSGVSILFLESSEMNFLHWLNEKRIRLEEQNVETYLQGLTSLNMDTKKNKKLNIDIEETANSLQLKFENTILEDRKLHEIGCQAYKSWVRFYASYPKESRTIFCFKQLHLGHYAKSFALRDPPSAIGGIGKPSESYMKKKAMIKNMKNKKVGKLKVETIDKKTERLVTSEFESGIKFKRKKK